MADGRAVTDAGWQADEGAESDGARLVAVPPTTLILYLRACVEAEHAASQYRVLGTRDVLVIGAGAAPLDQRRATLPSTDWARRWVERRKAAGSNEALFACWPVVTGRRWDQGRQQRVAAGLLITDVALGEDGRTLVPTSRSVDLDDAALGLLGMKPDEREQLLRDFAEAVKPGMVGALDQAIAFLRDRQIMDASADPADLSPFDDEATVSNSVIAWVGDADRSPFTRQLVDDLDAMARLGDHQLTVGPLGIVLGAAPASAAVTLEPTAAVLPTTLEQERAICSALSVPLTVVTGPPGTGKSQVLANTVAAAIARGDSVLLASKNNHAIDVVHERVASMGADAAPLRVGKRALREPAAMAMGQALSQATSDHSGFVQAQQRWEQTMGLVDRAYRQIAERAQAEADVVAARQEVDRARAALPDGVRVDPLLVDADMLASAGAVARRRLGAYDALPNRWFWQRKRKRAAEKELDEATVSLTALTGEGAQAACRSALASGGTEAVLTLAASIVDLLSRITELASAERRLSLLPDTAASDDAISASFATRQAPAKALYEATWRDHLRPDHPMRARARGYQADLASRAASGSGIGQLRQQVGAVLDVFPVWSVTSLAAGGWFPLRAGMFDLVIIDEASQSDLASAVPLLFRAKRAMVVGDPHQLTHITSLGAGLDERLADQAGLDDEQRGRFSYREASLYSAAAACLDQEPIFLNRHFRSHPDVIGFSNAAFYGSRLRVETDPSRFLDGPAFRWVDVQGIFETGPGGRSARNRPEAEAVMDVLGDMLTELEGTDRTVGIVTPFAPQRDLLIDLHAQRFPDASVTIDTAHGFQGDERDVMIYSPVVTEGVHAGLVRFAANPNLLNVALTRARARTVVVGDRAFAAGTSSLLADLAGYAVAIRP